MMQADWDEQAIQETVDACTKWSECDNTNAKCVDTILDGRPDEAEDSTEYQGNESCDDWNESPSPKETQIIWQANIVVTPIEPGRNKPDYDTREHAHVNARIRRTFYLRDNSIKN